MRVLVFRQPEQGEETAARLSRRGMGAPSTMLRMVPLPRFAGEEPMRHPGSSAVKRGRGTAQRAVEGAPAGSEPPSDGPRFESRGHEAILAPVLSIVPTGAPPPPGTFDALLVTSRNAIPALAAHRDIVTGSRIFAVGPRTGAALAAAGFRGAEVATGDAASLGALVGKRLPIGSALLHAAGRDRRPEPRSTLDAAGFRVTTWEVYAAEPATQLPEAARLVLAGGTVDAALHFSPRSAAIAERLAREAGLGAAFADVLHLCLSANVATAFADRPPRLAVADEPSEESLLALLDAADGRTD